MKKVIIFLISSLILLGSLSIVYAETKEVKLYVNESTTIGGKELRLIGISTNKEKVLVDIDGRKTNVKVKAPAYYYGIYIAIGEMGVYRRLSDSVVFYLSINFTCGDNVCSGGRENKESCCKDCNCSVGYICIENQCVKEELNECLEDADCNDSNICTTEYCSGIPRKCVRFNNSCGPRDGCCPSNCSIDDDPDCYLCEFDIECNDSNPCTDDACRNHRCVNEAKGCVLDDKCVEFGKVVDNYLCSENGTLIEQVVEEKVEKKGFFSRLFGWIINLFGFK